MDTVPVRGAEQPAHTLLPPTRVYVLMHAGFFPVHARRTYIYAYTSAASFFLAHVNKHACSLTFPFSTHDQ
jgi:hypothetical protein